MIAALVVLGLLVGVAGFGITLDPCTHSRAVACGTVGRQRFRELAGYVGVLLGVLTTMLAVAGRRRTAAAVALAGAASCLVAIAEGVRHWSS